MSDALDQVIANKGAAGVDEFEVETLAKDPSLREVWLLALAEELRTKTYRPSPVRRVYIWKDLAKTKRRALGIPTVKDRVVQSAAAIVLQPIWEADFHAHAYAYRPKRRTHQAMGKVKDALLSGKVEVVDADLSSYFDMIPHRELLQLVGQTGERWERVAFNKNVAARTHRGRGSRHGVPQGAPELVWHAARRSHLTHSGRALSPALLSGLSPLRFVTALGEPLPQRSRSCGEREVRTKADDGALRRRPPDLVQTGSRGGAANATETVAGGT